VGGADVPSRLPDLPSRLPGVYAVSTHQYLPDCLRGVSGDFDPNGLKALHDMVVHQEIGTDLIWPGRTRELMASDMYLIWPDMPSPALTSSRQQKPVGRKNRTSWSVLAIWVPVYLLPDLYITTSFALKSSLGK
jgi:hypothetical protein